MKNKPSQIYTLLNSVLINSGIGNFLFWIVLVAFVSCQEQESEITLPEFSTNSPSEITPTSVVLNGEFQSIGSVEIIDYGFVWSVTSTPTTSSNSKLFNAAAVPGNFSFVLENLLPSTKYFIRSFVITTQGLHYGNEVDFTTLEREKISPTLQTNNADEIQLSAATINGVLVDFGTSTKINEYGFIWSTTNIIDINSGIKINFGILVNPTTFKQRLTGLSEGTIYYFKTYAKSDEGIFYGEEKNFKTLVNPWKKIADFPGAARMSALAFSLKGKGYAGLGYAGSALKDLWEYDPDKNQWTRKNDFSGEARTASVVFKIGDKAYVGTGGLHSFYNDFWEYSPDTDQWVKKADFPGGLVYYASSFSIGEKGYVGTGIRNGTLLKEFWEYDPLLDKWSRKADFGGQPVDVAVGFAIGDMGYIGTGNLPLGRSRDFWQYNPANDVWTKKTDFPSDRMISTGFVLNGKGYIGLGNASPADFWIYDPQQNTWTQGPVFPGGVREGASAFVINNKAYVGLGAQGLSFTSGVWEYDMNRQ
jgi:N-acetylneuraminic acid mutarotase